MWLTKKPSMNWVGTPPKSMGALIHVYAGWEPSTTIILTETITKSARNSAHKIEQEPGTHKKREWPEERSMLNELGKQAMSNLLSSA